MFIILEKWMPNYCWKSHSLLCVKNENSFEKILQIWSNFFYFLLFLHRVWKIKARSASPRNFRLHVMTFEWILSKKHEIEKNTKSPNIHRNSVIRITDDLWSHVFFGTAMSFSTHTTNRPGKSEICNFVTHFRPLPSFLFRQENVFALNVSMNKVSLMNAFKALHDLNHHFKGMF